MANFHISWLEALLVLLFVFSLVSPKVFWGQQTNICQFCARTRPAIWQIFISPGFPFKRLIAKPKHQLLPLLSSLALFLAYSHGRVFAGLLTRSHC